MPGLLVRATPAVRPLSLEVAPHGQCTSREPRGLIQLRSSNGRSTPIARFKRALAQERGAALAVALAGSIALSSLFVAVIDYTSAGARNTRLSGARQQAEAMAEAALNNASATIFKSGNNPLNPYLFCTASETTLPCAAKTAGYDKGTATWTATLDQGATPYPTWTVTGTGSLRNPNTSTTGTVSRTLTMQVPVIPTFTSTLQSQAWNFVFVYGTGDPSGCDYQQINNSTMGSPLYVAGNLCLYNSAMLAGGPVDVGGTATFNSVQNSVGTLGSPITTGVHIAGGCKLKPALTFDVPCKVTDNVFASPAADSTLASIGFPQPSWQSWYLNAAPGPYFGCYSSSGTAPTGGTWATFFDNNQTSPESPDSSREDRSVTGAGGSITLTSVGSYTCKSPAGQLSWNASTSDSATYGPARTLTVNGSVFIDGNARIDTGGAIRYQGQGTLLLSGSFVLKSTNLCAVLSSNGNHCDWVLGAGHWDPNSTMLDIVAGDKYLGGNQQDAPSDDTSVELLGAEFQGGVLAMHRMDVSTSSSTQGPLVCNKLTVGQTLTTYAFPTITNVPVATPGNLVKFGTPQTPTNFH
jgi:Tfp pilus assembly protein PilX